MVYFLFPKYFFHPHRSVLNKFLAVLSAFILIHYETLKDFFMHLNTLIKLNVIDILKVMETKTLPLQVL